MTYKAVWIASMPRSASMWTFNVTRSLLRKSGLTVFPRTIPKNDEQMLELARKGLQDTNPNNVWCLKVHDRLPPDTPASRFISTYRDPRDAVLSFMRFTRCNFESALGEIPFWKAICDHYRELPSGLSLCLDYEAIVAEPVEIAARIDEFLGLNLTRPSLAAAVAEFEPEKVRRRIEAVQNDLRESADGDIDRSDSLAVNEDGTLRVFDGQTGFQSGHISDYRSGDWRFLLTAEQRRRLEQAVRDWRLVTRAA